MPTPHVSELPFAAKVEGGINFGNDQSLLVDGDLTSATTAKANVQTKVDKLHVSERTFGPRVKMAIDAGDQFASGFSTGSSIAGINNVITGIRVVGTTPAF